MSELGDKIAGMVDKEVAKLVKQTKKEVAGENKSENYKTLDGLVRSVAKKADVGEEATSLKKCKDLANKFDRNENPTRADVEKLIKSLGSHLLSMPKEVKAKKQKVEA